MYSNELWNELHNYAHMYRNVLQCTPKDWRTLESRRADACLCLLYKQQNGLAYGYEDRLQPVSHKINTRLPDHYYKQISCARDYYQKSFYPRTISQWNKLPTTIATSGSLDTFKQAVRTINYLDWPADQHYHYIIILLVLVYIFLHYFFNIIIVNF